MTYLYIYKIVYIYKKIVATAYHYMKEYNINVLSTT